jgi:GNAT superfamily N-acetyltransferase
VKKSREYPVGHVTTRRDGSRWRKVSTGKWEEVKEASPKQDLADLRDESKKLGVKLDAWGGDGEINLGRIEVSKEKRGQGLGERVMAKLLALSDKHKQTLTLTPSGQWGGSVPKLRKWYGRLGFVENKGKHKDYEISEAMYRRPKALKKSRGFPVGHISTRRDGSQWRKKSPDKWEMVRPPREARTPGIIDPHHKPKAPDYGPGDLIDPQTPGRQKLVEELRHEGITRLGWQVARHACRRP